MKKKNIFIIIFIILVGILIYLFIIKDNNNVNKPDEELEINHEFIISASFSKFGLCSTGIYFDFSQKNKYTFNDLDDNVIYHILYNYLSVNNKIEVESNSNGEALLSESNNRVERIKKSDLEQAFKILFGKKIFKKFKFKENFIIDIYEFKLVKDIYYTNKIESYICNNDYQSNYYLIDTKKDNNKITLEYALYYSQFEYENDKLNEYALYEPNDDFRICLVQDIKNHLNEFNRYSFTFVKEGSNYIFDSITLVK